MAIKGFQEYVDRGLITEDEAIQFDQSWENARHLLDGGDEVTDKEKEELLLDYQAMFSLLEEVESKLIELDEENEGRKEIINNHFNV